MYIGDRKSAVNFVKSSWSGTALAEVRALNCSSLYKLQADTCILCELAALRAVNIY